MIGVALDYDELHQKVLPLGMIEVLATVQLLFLALDHSEYLPRPVCLWEELELVVFCVSYRNFASAFPSAVCLPL